MSVQERQRYQQQQSTIFKSRITQNYDEEVNEIDPYQQSNDINYKSSKGRESMIRAKNQESLYLFNKYSSAMDVKNKLINSIYQGRKQTYKMFNRQVVKNMGKFEKKISVPQLPLKLTLDDVKRIQKNKQTQNKKIKNEHEFNGKIYYTDLWNLKYQKQVMDKAQLEIISRKLVEGRKISQQLRSQAIKTDFGVLFKLYKNNDNINPRPKQSIFNSLYQNQAPNHDHNIIIEQIQGQQNNEISSPSPQKQIISSRVSQIQKNINQEIHKMQENIISSKIQSVTESSPIKQSSRAKNSQDQNDEEEEIVLISQLDLEPQNKLQGINEDSDNQSQDSSFFSIQEKQQNSLNASQIGKKQKNRLDDILQQQRKSSSFHDLEGLRQKKNNSSTNIRFNLPLDIQKKTATTILQKLEQRDPNKQNQNKIEDMGPRQKQSQSQSIVNKVEQRQQSNRAKSRTEGLHKLNSNSNKIFINFLNQQYIFGDEQDRSLDSQKFMSPQNKLFHQFSMKFNRNNVKNNKNHSLGNELDFKERTSILQYYNSQRDCVQTQNNISQTQINSSKQLLENGDRTPQKFNIDIQEEYSLNKNKKKLQEQISTKICRVRVKQVSLNNFKNLTTKYKDVQQNQNQNILTTESQPKSQNQLDMQQDYIKQQQEEQQKLQIPILQKEPICLTDRPSLKQTSRSSKINFLPPSLNNSNQNSARQSLQNCNNSSGQKRHKQSMQSSSLYQSTQENSDQDPLTSSRKERYKAQRKQNPQYFNTQQNVYSNQIQQTKNNKYQNSEYYKLQLSNQAPLQNTNQISHKKFLSLIGRCKQENDKNQEIIMASKEVQKLADQRANEFYILMEKFKAEQTKNMKQLIQKTLNKQNQREQIQQSIKNQQHMQKMAMGGYQ